MIKLINKDGGNINLTAPSGGAVSGGYYQPIIDEKGNLNWFPSNTSMPTVEGYNIYNAVKVWSAADGITCNSDSPLDFDFSQITKTEVMGLSLELNNIDLTPYEGRNVGACILFRDAVKKFFLFFNFISIGGTLTCAFIQVSDDGKTGACVYLRKGDSYIDFTANEEGWYFGDFDVPEVEKVEGLTNYIGDFNNLMIVDFGSMQLEQASQVYGIEIENVADDFINTLISFHLPEGYYKTPRNKNKKANTGGGIDIPITEEDEGKFLMVQGGAVALVSIPNITEVIF